MTQETLARPEARPAAQPSRHRVLVCPPDFFKVEYAINPWMDGNAPKPDPARAMEQWKGLVRELSRTADVETLAPCEELPDLVFASNSAIVVNNRAVLAHFRFPERQREEPVYKAWFQAHGFETFDMPRGMYFEGSGDAVFDRVSGRVFMGYGFRSVLEASEFLSEKLGVEVVALRLVNERFYQLSTCFCPLEGGYLLWYPPAFDERAQRTIEEIWPAEKRLAASDRNAFLLACNALNFGRRVLLHDCTPLLEQELVQRGFEVTRVNLSEFLLSGGSARCLALTLTDAASAAPARRTEVARRIVTLEGHLIDSGLLAKSMDMIVASGGSFETLEFRIGQRREDKSFVRVAVIAPTNDHLEQILARLLDSGAKIEGDDVVAANLVEVELDGVAPEDFYSTTIFPTDVYVDGQWIRATRQRMDGVLVIERPAGGPPTATVTLMRNVRRGQKVVVGYGGIRIHVRQKEKDDEEFKFMSSNVSSERRVEVAVENIAWEMSQIRARGGRIVLVSGPVAVHTGGIEYLCELVRMGYVQALLGGNAIAVHDIEREMFGTSLGVDLKRGNTVHGGHRHHLIAINRVRRAGSIAKAVEQGLIKAGLMYELVRNNVPFCLAGSIRDDGPLPDTRMDLIQAQTEYQQLLQGAEMVLMLSSMLHSIGTGNMTPAGVRMVCVDINTAVATKLADRGSTESVPVVTDVGLFLNMLVRKLKELR